MDGFKLILIFIIGVVVYFSLHGQFAVLWLIPAFYVCAFIYALVAPEFEKSEKPSAQELERRRIQKTIEKEKADLRQVEAEVQEAYRKAQADLRRIMDE